MEKIRQYLTDKNLTQKIQIMKKLRLYLTKMNLTQIAAAKRFGISGTTMCHILQGKYSPSVAMAMRIQKATRGWIKVADLRPAKGR